jgi:hypothetical protein
MKKILSFSLLTLLFSAVPLAAQRNDFYVELAEFGGPVVPTLSRVLVGIPGEIFSDSPLLRRFGVDIWYMAYSPYLWPDIFVELGAQIKYYPILRERSSLRLSIGTAYEYFGGAFGVPLITGLSWEIGLPVQLWTGIALDLLLWPGSGGIELTIPIRYRMESGLDLSLLPGVTAYTDMMQFVVNPRIALAVGYRFGRAR